MIFAGIEIGFMYAIREFQTLIVGALGFAGVIITLWINALLVRNQRHEERRQEARALRAALLEELKINLASVTRNISTAESAKHGIAAPTSAMDDAYRSFINRIGLLSRNEVSKLMEAYLRLRTYHDTVSFLGATSRSDSGYVNIHSKDVPSVAKLLKGLIKPIEQAIIELEKSQKA